MLWPGRRPTASAGGRPCNDAIRRQPTRRGQPAGPSCEFWTAPTTIANVLRLALALVSGSRPLAKAAKATSTTSDWCVSSRGATASGHRTAFIKVLRSRQWHSHFADAPGTAAHGADERLVTLACARKPSATRDPWWGVFVQVLKPVPAGALRAEDPRWRTSQ